MSPAKRVELVVGSVDGQDAHATGAAAGAAENVNVEATGGVDHRRGNRHSDLRTTLHRGGESDAIEDYHGGGNELAPGLGEDETGRQL